MNKCIKCGSYAFNLYKEDIDQGGLCDVHYWQGRAHRAEALAEQPAQQDMPKIGCVNHDCDKCKAQHQEPVAWMYQCSADSSGPVLMQHKRDWAESGSGLWTETPLYTSPPASKPWVGLTDEEIKRMAAPWFLSMYWPLCNTFARAIEAKLREKNA